MLPRRPRSTRCSAAYGVDSRPVAPGTPIGFNSDQHAVLDRRRNTAAQTVVNFRGDTTDPGFNPTIYSYNFSPVNYLQLPLERRQIAGFGRYDMIAGQRPEMYSRIMFTTYNADQELAATPVTCAGAAIPGCIVPVTNDRSRRICARCSIVAYARSRDPLGR